MPFSMSLLANLTLPPRFVSVSLCSCVPPPRSSDWSFLTSRFLSIPCMPLFLSIMANDVSYSTLMIPSLPNRTGIFFTMSKYSAQKGTKRYKPIIQILVLPPDSHFPNFACPRGWPCDTLLDRESLGMRSLLESFWGNLFFLFWKIIK